MAGVGSDAARSTAWCEFAKAIFRRAQSQLQANKRSVVHPIGTRESPVAA